MPEEDPSRVGSAQSPPRPTSLTSPLPSPPPTTGLENSEPEAIHPGEEVCREARGPLGSPPDTVVVPLPTPQLLCPDPVTVATKQSPGGLLPPGLSPGVPQGAASAPKSMLMTYQPSGLSFPS